MKRMATPTRDVPSDKPGDPAGRARRAWVRPVLVEYGHLAKLTRGTSGAIAEFTTKKVKCL